MNVSQAIDIIRPSVVQIAFLATDLSNEAGNRLGRPFLSLSFGTGFFVSSDGYVLTARHVLEAATQTAAQVEAGQKRTLVALAQPNTQNMRGNFTLVDFDVVDEDARHDLALLKLRQNPFRGEVHSGIRVGNEEVPLLFGTATLNPARPSDGAAIAISGYPLGEPVLVTNVGHMATSWATTIEKVPVPGAPTPFTWPDVADIYLADIEVNPGNSGGPVYLVESGAVVGVCVASKPSPIRDQNGDPAVVDGRQLFYSSGLTQVVPARYVVELAQKYGLK